MPPSFAWQFPSPCYPDLAALVQALPNPLPSWVVGLTLHHTWKPTVDQWRGERSMAALGRFERTGFAERFYGKVQPSDLKNDTRQ